MTTAPGVNPASTGITVTGNLASIGGSSTQTFFDNGTNGDMTAGDGIYSYTYAIPAATPVGAASIGFTVADAQARSSTGSLNFTVLLGSPAAGTYDETAVGVDAGELLTTATGISGNGSALNSISGVYETGNMDMYQIQICDTAAFSATTVGGTTGDTQIFLFNAAGNGVSFNDDTLDITQSTIDNTGVTAPGLYYLAVGGYNRDPRDANSQLLWNNMPFSGVRTPDGPGAANPVSSWVNNGGTAAYTITLTGACSVNTGPVCGSSDFDGDGDAGTDSDIEAFFACLAGTCCPTCYSGGSDFDGDGDAGTDADIEAFFRVLAGQPC